METTEPTKIKTIIIMVVFGVVTIIGGVMMLALAGEKEENLEEKEEKTEHK